MTHLEKLKHAPRARSAYMRHLEAQERYDHWGAVMRGLLGLSFFALCAATPFICWWILHW